MSDYKSLKKIALISAPGGVGKTTIVMLLAYLFRMRSKNVLVVDVDPSAGLSLYLMGEDEYQRRIERGKTLANMIEKVIVKGEEIDVRDYTKEVMVLKRTFDLIPSSDELSDVIGKIWFGGQYGKPGEMLKKVFESIDLSTYDIVIFDTIPFYERRYTTLSIYAADYYLVPLTPAKLDNIRTRRMLRKFRSIADEMGILESDFYSKFGIVYSKVDRVRHRDFKKGEGVPTAYKNAFLDISASMKVFDNYIPFSKELEDLKNISKLGKAEDDLINFFRELLEWIGEPLPY